MERGDLKGAATAAHRIEREPGFEPHARLLRGAVLLHSGDRDSALRQFAQVQPEGDLRVPVMLLTTQCLYHLGRIAEAEVVARQLAAEQPENADAHRWLGAVYYDLGANALAVGELQRVAELSPQDFACHRLLGIMYLDFEEYADAIEHFRQALERTPPKTIRIEITENLAKALIAHREYAEALDVLRTAEPTPLVLALRSECHWSLNEKDLAKRILSEARQRAPNEPFILLLQGRINLADGRPELAVAPLQQALKIDRHETEARYQLAQAYRQLGDLDRFEEEMSKWKASNELLERLTELSNAAIARPSDGTVRRELAEVCEALGRHELAASWRRAASAYPRAAGGG